MRKQVNKRKILHRNAGFVAPLRLLIQSHGTPMFDPPLGVFLLLGANSCKLGKNHTPGQKLICCSSDVALPNEIQLKDFDNTVQAIKNQAWTSPIGSV